MNLISLNINGIGNGDFKLDWVNNLIKTHRAGVVGIQETKRKEFTEKMVKRLWGATILTLCSKKAEVKEGARSRAGTNICSPRVNPFVKMIVLSCRASG